MLIKRTASLLGMTLATSRKHLNACPALGPFCVVDPVFLIVRHAAQIAYSAVTLPPVRMVDVGRAVISCPSRLLRFRPPATSSVRPSRPSLRSAETALAHRSPRRGRPTTGGRFRRSPSRPARPNRSPPKPIPPGTTPAPTPPGGRAPCGCRGADRAPDAAGAVRRHGRRAASRAVLAPAAAGTSGDGGPSLRRPAGKRRARGRGPFPPSGGALPRRLRLGDRPLLPRGRR